MMCMADTTTRGDGMATQLAEIAGFGLVLDDESTDGLVAGVLALVARWAEAAPGRDGYGRQSPAEIGAIVAELLASDDLQDAYEAVIEVGYEDALRGVRASRS
jgi:hypothetical protein